MWWVSGKIQVLSFTSVIVFFCSIALLQMTKCGGKIRVLSFTSVLVFFLALLFFVASFSTLVEALVPFFILICL